MSIEQNNENKSEKWLNDLENYSTWFLQVAEFFSDPKNIKSKDLIWILDKNIPTVA